jgi:hypothetical protein
MNDAARYFANVLDDAGRLTADVPCLNCRYNLRGLAPEGVCPECGTPVFDKSRLCFAAPTWLQRLNLGLMLLLVVLLLLLAGVVVQRIFEAPPPATVGQPVKIAQRVTIGHIYAYVYAALPLIQMLVALAAVLLVMSRDPAQRAQPEKLYPRRFAWYIAVAFPVVGLPAILSYALISWSAFARAWPVLGCLTTVGWTLLAIVVLHRLTLLLERVPHRLLLRYAQVVLWLSVPLLAAGAAVTIVATFIRPLRLPSSPYAVLFCWAAAPMTALLPTVVLFVAVLVLLILTRRAIARATRQAVAWHAGMSNDRAPVPRGPGEGDVRP